jgi:hypothetical protein
MGQIVCPETSARNYHSTLRKKMRAVSEIATHHVTRHNTPIHHIVSTAPQLSISQKALEMLPENGNVMSKLVGATIHN